MKSRSYAGAPIALTMILAACAGASPATKGTPSASRASTFVEPPAPSQAAPVLRLPEGVRPTRYAAELTIDPRAPRFSGRVSIDIDVMRPTREIWLNATELSITRATVTFGTTTQVAEVAIAAPDGDFLRVTVAHAIPAGAARLTLDYDGALDATHSRGLYREKENDEWYVYSFFEPIDARRAFPTFDEPEFKVPWAITLHVPKADVALTNSPAVGEHDEANGMKEVVFAESKPMPTYAVALIVGPFDLVEHAAGPRGKPLRIAVPRGRGAEARYAADHTTELVSRLEEYFGMPYPYDKLDVAVVPRYWGTMEHPGLVALGQPLTLIRPAEETEERREKYVNIAVHELAHYWFGDYVTMRWWDDTWLNEAFASWMDQKVTDGFAPQWELPIARLAMIELAKRSDSAETAKALRQPVAARNDIGASFDREITYWKGSAVVRMMEHWLGDARFQAVIRRYMKKFAWKNASSEDLYALLEAEQPGATNVLKGFAEQPGLPLVSVQVTCEAGEEARVSLAQSRFLPGVATTRRTTWSIPVCLRYPTSGGESAKASGTGRACVLLDQETMTAPLPGAKECPAWIEANDDASGYYRVRYDGDGFARMIAPGPTPLTARERLVLLADQRALIAAGEAPAASLLGIVPRLATDRDPKIVMASVDFLTGCDALLPPELWGAFGRFVHATFAARARALGWVDRPKDDADTRAMRKVLLPFVAVAGNDAALSAEARRLALAWLGDRGALRGETVEAVLATAVATGDAALFERVVAEAKRTEERRERELLLRALGMARDPALANAALDLVAGDAFDLRESSALVKSMAAVPETRDRAFDFLLAHFDALAARVRDDEASWLLTMMASACDETRRARAESQLTARASTLAGGAQALKKALGSIRSCEATEAVMRPALTKFLEER